MTPATQILLFGKPFRIADYFRMGQIGWHWQFDDPNLLYRRRNWLTATNNLSVISLGNLTRTLGASTTPDGTSATRLTVTLSTTSTIANTGAAITSTAATARMFVTVKQVSGTPGARFLIRNSTTASDGDTITLNYTTGAVTGSGSITQGVSYPLGSGWWLLVLTRTTGLSRGDGIIGYFGWLGESAVTAGAAIDIAKVQLDFGDTTTTQAAVEAAYQPVPTTWPQAYLDAVGAERIYAWTDTAGTIPVTAIGDGIGLLLGREYGGVRGSEMASANYATAATYDNITTVVSASAFTQTVGTTLGRTYLNLITVVGKTYEVSSSITTTDASGVLLYARTLPAGTGTILATSPSIASGGTARVIFTATTTVSSVLWSTQTVARIVNATGITVREIPGTHLTQATGTAKPTLSARVNLLLNTATMSTQNVTTVATSYKLSFTGTGTVTLSGTSTAGPLVGTGANDRVSLTFTPTAGTLTLTVSGSVTLADLRTADDAAKNIPAYQRVGATATDHDTDGFPHAQTADGTDDSGTTATGGGNTTGFFYCGALTVSGGAGTARTIWSDTGTNTGYRVRINSSNKLELAAGNGSAYTTVQSNETITAPGTYLLSAWDDGGVLAVQVNNLAPATTTRPTVSAGTAAITVYKDNGAASSYFNGRDYGSVYAQRYIGESAHNRLKRYLANVARITA